MILKKKNVDKIVDVGVCALRFDLLFKLFLITSRKFI
jgi:hypothetical protein